MDWRLLEEIGLAKSEMEVYVALIRLGSSRVGELMKEISIHRSRIYEAINRLEDKGLVSHFIKNNVRYFEASEPENLLTYIEEEKNKLDDKQKAIRKIIPTLRSVPLKPRAEAHVLVGKEGFKTMRNDVLKQKQDLYLIGALGKENKVLQYYFPHFENERIKLGIKWNVLFDHRLKGKKITQLSLMACRFLPETYSGPKVINIYADRVVNVLWQGNEPLCFMVINKDIADSYRKWFKLLWNNSSQN